LKSKVDPEKASVFFEFVLTGFELEVKHETDAEQKCDFSYQGIEIEHPSSIHLQDVQY